MNLRAIHTFKQLVRYLEDELDWPLEGHDIEDLTFDYEPDELGLKAEDAAKVKAIRQLRPLDSKQPWGIFFIEFDRKKLPVVVLRRILSHLVVKKRASANKANRAAWHAEDLLFISAFGAEDDGREISFAHFHQEEGDMPTLRVLGWDGGDTPLKLEHLATTLKERLHWPDHSESLDQWRARWAGVFRHRIGHVINTSDMLAEAMAVLAKRIRDAAQTLIDRESDKGPLRKLHQAFKTHLIHDLTEEGFADTYAQTITYGLLTAAISRTEMSEGKHGTALVASNVTDMVPVTNPFLKEMLQTFLHVGGRKGGIDFDELGVQDVVELLRGEETDLPAILRDFGNKTRGEDPVIHFYEHFLNAYNKQLRIQRGVFYTPNPVVSYIVRSADELLKTEFHLEHGLADTITWGEFIQKSKISDPQSPISLPPLTDEPGCTETISPDEFFVQILDPATGTATFLVEVIDVIYNYLKDLWKKRGAAAMPVIPNSKSNIQNFSDYWNEYVPKALLPRLHAYELMMAPYAIAHMKVGLKLAETGYKFATEERARIYLTNALEPWVKQLPLIGFDALAHEAAAVNEIKRCKRFTVVIGNPPYSNFGQLNKNPFILGLLEDYKRGLDERKINLDDDFIKFVRFAQWCVSTSQLGVFGFITNNIFLEGATHRRMRCCIAETFGKLRVVDLHGDGRKQQKGLDGVQDENVFDIIQGVAVSLFTKPPGVKTPATQVATIDLIGPRSGDPAGKYEWLVGHSTTTTHWATVELQSPNHFFVKKDLAFGDEYLSAPSINEVFSMMWSGIQTKRDSLTVDWSVEDSWRKISRAAEMKPAELLREFELPEDGRDWKADLAIQDLRKSGPDKKHIIQFAYRPLDTRFIYYTARTKGWIAYPRREASDQLLRTSNIALIVKRSRMINVDYFCHICVVNSPPDINYLADQTYFMPLYSAAEVDGSLFHQTEKRSNRGGRTHNVTPKVLRQLRDALGIRFLEDGVGDLNSTFGPDDIFHYAYAVLHSPGYRSRYAEFLKIDFPRLPLTGNLELFRALARLGGELTALHLLESSKLAQPITGFIGKSKEVTKIGWADDTVWINASGSRGNTTAGTSGFRGVPEAVWNFHIGGYQVCEKWLKDRKGRTLTEEDITRYHKIVIALTETIRVMAEIDQVIESHGGWPGAFSKS